MEMMLKALMEEDKHKDCQHVLSECGLGVGGPSLNYVVRAYIAWRKFGLTKAQDIKEVVNFVNEHDRERVAIVRITDEELKKLA